MNFAAGITVYYPKYEQLERLAEYTKCFDKVIIYDNTEEINNDIISFCRRNNIIYYGNGINDGLPKAFNTMLYCIETSDCDFLCLLDQDSLFDINSIETIKDAIEKSEDKDKLGIIAPTIDYGNKFNRNLKGIIQKDWVITSGSFLNLNEIKKRNIRYDENYFIDRCDADFCKLLSNENLKILECCDAVLHQRLGEDSGYKHPNHNVIRHYYIFRDRLFYNKKHYTFLKRCIKNILQNIRHYYLILRYENNKLKKLRISFTAFHDYYIHKSGKADL